MAQMTDPSAALKSFQEALDGGAIQLQRGIIDPELFVHSDQPNGMMRLTYVRIDRAAVSALVMFALVARFEDGPRFQIGYAVPGRYRSHGRAKEIVKSGITELQRGLARSGILQFSVEAIVGKDNEPSMKVAAATISASPTEITDSVSGLPAFQYLRKIGGGEA